MKKGSQNIMVDAECLFGGSGGEIWQAAGKRRNHTYSFVCKPKSIDTSIFIYGTRNAKLPPDSSFSR